VKYSGEGIDPEILTRLFSKYATKSFEGKCLAIGLFVCKSIFKAQGDRI
jgi:hypothetical protein